MENYIWIGFNIFGIGFLLYVIYRSYINQKYYSGKKFIWSKEDRHINNLEGYHCYENPLTWYIVTTGFAYRFLSDYIESSTLRIFNLLINTIIIGYIVYSFIKIGSIENTSK